MQLVEIANARSGDKGNKVNIALFAKHAADYDRIVEQVTIEKVRQHFNAYILGEIERYEVPTLYGLNFVCHDALAGGGSASLRMDNLGKCFGSSLLRMSIE